MRWFTNLRFRLRALVFRADVNRELDREVSFHIDMETEKYLRQGMSEAEARRMAHLKFGGEDRFKEHARSSWGVRWILDAFADGRFAVRQLVRNPVSSAVSVLTLALGIAGAAAFFGVVDGLLLRPLPFPDEDRVVVFWSELYWRGAEYDLVRDATLAESDGVFDEVAAYTYGVDLVRGENGGSLWETGVVSAEAFGALDVEPLLGRVFRSGEDRPGAEPVAILSHRIWVREFGSDANIVGQRVSLDDLPTTIIGVMKPDFYFPSPDIDAWTPLPLDPTTGNYRSNGYLVLFGKLREGTTPAEVERSVTRITDLLSRNFTYSAEADRTQNAVLTPIRDRLLGDVRSPLLLLVGAVGLFFLMACVNVSTLMVSRSLDRRNELSVRTAIGAERGRLARQVLAESVVLGLVAGGVGGLLALALHGGLVRNLPVSNGLETTLSLEWDLLLVTLVLSLGVGAVIALVPVRTFFGARMRTVFDRLGRGTADRSAGGRLQRTFVTVQVILAMTLLTGATLFIRTVDELQSIDVGIDSEGAVAVDLFLSRNGTSIPERRIFLSAAKDRVEAIPGVSSVGIVNRLPVRDGGFQGSVSIEDRPDLVGSSRPSSYWRSITPGLLEALGLDIVQGRDVGPEDGAEAVSVALVSEAFARRMWPGESPLGRRVRSGFEGDTTWNTVVGVVEDIRIGSLVSESPPVLYRPQAQTLAPGVSPVLVIRSDSDPTAVISSTRSVLQDLDPSVAIDRAVTLEEVLDGAIGQPLQLRFFLILFGAMACVLGMVGVFGVISYSVNRRFAEYGVRLALGAGPGGLQRGILRGALRPVAVGILGGALLSIALSRVVTGFLYNVNGKDPLSLALAGTALLLAGILAAWIPARRAARMDPVRALRAE